MFEKVTFSPRRRTLSFIAPAFLAAAILTSGCATGNRVALDQTHRSSIEGTRAVVGMKDSTIQAEFDQSKVTSITGGGLIPALIDAAVDRSRSDKATAASDPLRQALADTHLGEKFARHLETSLASVDWLRASSVEFADLTEEKYLPSFLASTEHGHLLVFETAYSLTPDFKSLKVEVETGLYQVATSAKPIYFNRLLAFNDLQGVEGKIEREQAITHWIANEAAPIRTALVNGINEISAMLTFDLLADASAPEGRALNLNGIRGIPVQEDNGRVWLRTRAGHLYSFVQ